MQTVSVALGAFEQTSIDNNNDNSKTSVSCLQGRDLCLQSISSIQFICLSLGSPREVSAL